VCVCLERIKRIAGKYYKKMKEGKENLKIREGDSQERKTAMCTVIQR
jgi:hypothetical protein